MVGIESRLHLGAGNTEANPRGAHDEYGQTVDPATSPALAPQSALPPAAQALFDEGCRWADAVRQPMLPPARGEAEMFAWSLTRDTAEAVAAHANVGVDAINGAASVLLVEDVWWALIATQFALCSVAAAQDPYVAEGILREVFSSGLTTA